MLCIGLCGVGFSAWVISSGAEASVPNAQFEVYTVKNEAVQMTAKIADNDVVKFGGVDDDKASGTAEWLNCTQNEDLTANLEITISNLDVITSDKITLTVKVTTAAAIGNLIKLPEDITVTLTKTDESWTPNVGTLDENTITVPLTFSWGDAFESNSSNVNPEIYYSYIPYDTQVAATAQAQLETLYNLGVSETNGVKQVQFTVTVDAKVGASTN